MSRESIFQHDGKPVPTDLVKELEQCMFEAVNTLVLKSVTYGDSWKQRGGVGAFMMLARKFDRIQNIANAHGWDIFDACDSEWGRTDGVMDDIRDLRNYLTLVEHEMRKRHGEF